ncbi:restriction endonuclease subunit S [Streptomyces sp. NPDC059690]|uniref:methylation-associated defense system restriction endonuclease subunit S MAD5 n=1 Tax=Streptomyces sp. NPDC059690 TaxID=3346907 RepID=UPI00367F640D
MKVVSLTNPVTSEWLTDQGFRLDPAPYLSGALEARKLLNRLPDTVALATVTAGHNGGIFNGPKFRRVYVSDPEQGVPFLGSTDMLEIDLTSLPRLKKTDAESDKLSYLQVKPGMTLISCSGSIGRMAYVRPDMGGFWSSQDVLKVQSDPQRIRSGYLYAFLSSRFGEALVKSSAYGAIIQHIEPHHIADLPVPRFGTELEERIHRMVEISAKLRARFQAGLVAATEDFFTSADLPELVDLRWHEKPRDTGFSVHGLSSLSLRAINYAERAKTILESLSSVPHRRLGDICATGKLSYGNIFKRVDAAEGHGGLRMVGQRDMFWVRPEGRWISPAHAPRDIFVTDETVLMTARAMPSENGLFGRVSLITGQWLEHVYSHNIFQIRSSDPQMPGAYLHSLLRSDAAMRAFRHMLIGTGQQSLNPRLVADFPVPETTAADRHRIAETVRRAYRNRDRADVLEDQAIALLTKAIEEAAA